MYDMLHIICDMGRDVVVSFFNKVLRKHESGRRRTRKKLVAFILAVGLMFSLVGCGPKADSETLTLRFATDSSEDYVSTVQIYKFAEEVEEKRMVVLKSKSMPVLSWETKNLVLNRFRWVV